MSEDKKMSARGMSALIAVIVLSASMDYRSEEPWVAVVLSAVTAAPVIIICSRIAAIGSELWSNSPAQRFTAAALAGSALYTAVETSAKLAALVASISLSKTPAMVLVCAAVAVSLYLASQSIRSIKRWSEVCLMAVLLSIIITTMLSVGLMDADKLLPVYSAGAGLITDSMRFAVRAFLDTALILFAFGAPRNGSPYKTYALGAVIGWLGLSVLSLRNTLVLGPKLSALFPSYTVSRVVKLGSYMEHMETLISFTLVLIGITKIALCLNAAAKGARIAVHGRGLVTLPVLALLIPVLYGLYSGGYVLPWAAAAFPLLLIPVWLSAERRVRQS